jgi:hypothetical protein
MSKWSKEELESMLESVINELELTPEMIEKHGQEGTEPAELVRLTIEDLKFQGKLIARNVRHRAAEIAVETISKVNANPLYSIPSFVSSSLHGSIMNIQFDEVKTESF